MRPTPRRVTISASVLALLCGAVLGLLTFAAAAALWRTGQAHVARATADAVFVAALGAMAGVTLLAQPARLRRARVPVGRAVPRAWWPPPHDPLPALTACLGGPLAAGAGAAALLFR